MCAIILAVESKGNPNPQKTTTSFSRPAFCPSRELPFLTGLRNLDFLYHLRSHLFSPHILLLHPKLSPQNHEVSADVSLGFGFEHLFLSGVVVLTLVRQIFTQPFSRSLTEATCFLAALAGFLRSHLYLQLFKVSFELSLDNRLL